MLRTLGAGGMGVVYEALDRERNTRVAIKTLHSLNADALLRFKNEFRAFQDLQHPNLVSIGELFCENNEWFFSMELVDGVSFLAYVRPRQLREVPPGWPPPGESASSVITSDSVDFARSHIIKPPSSQGGASFHEERLRGALRQLALGLGALHDAGKVHRDIKPSNVMVTPHGRVVLLDFGLAADHAQREHKSDVDIVGTIEYMAPEQAAGRQVGPPADWYAVGVMLYETLTGQLPLTGPAMEVLMNKQRLDAPSPRAITPNAPEDLSKLCAELLRFNPSARPSGKQVLEVLGIPAMPSSSASLSSFSTSSHFVGRERELFTLREAFERAHQSPQVITVYGESGVGKSALVRRFTELTISREPSVVVLRGTCYERESVPFKAVDGVIDSLSRYMRRLPKAEAAALLPRKASLLVQVFPVLARVEAVAEAPRTPEPSQDPQELRSRLFGALRELFVRLTDRHPVLLVIDDLQWADADSLALLADLLRPPEAPNMLLVATVRSAGNGTRTHFTLPNLQELDVERLPPAEARELATALLARARVETGLKPHQIAQEADGHPLFIDELIRHACSVGGSDEGPLQLEDALWARVMQVDPTARRVLELVCLSGGRLIQQTAANAAGLSFGDFAKQVALLRVAHLLRTSGMRGTDHVEPYHGRVRAAVLGHLSSDTARAHHRRIALALETSGHPDPEALTVHWREVGDLERTAHFAEIAAEKASKALAFDRAARFYELCLDALPDGDPRMRPLRVKLADALSNAGRSGEAGDAYLRAATGAGAPEMLELRRRAAEQLLISGRIDLGLSTLHEVLTSARMNLAETPRRALMRLVWSRAQLRLRGLRFKEQDPSAIPAEELMRIDICWSTGIALGLVDSLRGADFQARNLLLSLRAGEPYRVARALAMESGYVAIEGSKTAARTAHLQREAASIADRVGHPHAIGLVKLMSGIGAFLDGKWQAACDRCGEAETIFRDRCTGVTWELDNAKLYPLWARIFLGQLGDLGTRASLLLNEARARGDLYLETNLRTRVVNMSLLAADQPETARHEVEEGIAGWSQQGFHLQNYFALHSRVEIALYEGQGAVARQLIEDAWPRLRDSDFLMVQLMRIETLALRARCTLMAATQDKARAPALWAAARGFASRLVKEKSTWATAFAHLIKATAEGEGQVTDANRSVLLQAKDEFENSGMALHAAAIIARLGHEAQAAEVMQSQGIRDPRRMIDLFAPGL